MRILPQIKMFDHTLNEEFIGDLERLKKVIDNAPDSKLINRLNEISVNVNIKMQKYSEIKMH